MTRRRQLVAVSSSLLLAACSSRSSPGGSPPPPDGGSDGGPGGSPVLVTPVTPTPPGPAPVPAGLGSGLAITTLQGLTLVDPPLAGEAAFEGAVQVEFQGALPPPDTTVDLNGVALVPASFHGSRKFWKLDPAGPQPVLGAGGTITVTAVTGSLVRSVPLRCPDDVAITSSAPIGQSLSGIVTLDLSWPGDLRLNASNPLLFDFYPAAKLNGLDLAAKTQDESTVSQALVPQGATGVALALVGSNASGYVAEVRWPGPYVDMDGSRAFCSRAKRIQYLH
jgi:hypothetical protein